MISPVSLTLQAAERRYWRSVALLVVALVVAIGLVWAMGSSAGVRARRLLPEPGSEVGIRPTIRVLFARPVEQGSVEAAVSVEPPVPFDLSWAENELRILPRQPLAAATDYTVRIGPGVRDSSGSALDGVLSWRFRTRQPRIAFLRPNAETLPELWIAELDGSGARRLSAPGQLVRDFDAAPDGSLIVYVVEEGPSTANLWRILPTQPGFTRLTEEQGSVYSAPRFSPGGELVALEVRREVTIGDQGRTLGPPRLELRRPTDGSPAGLIYGEGQQIGHSPRWSPDGTRIAFIEADQNALGLFNFTSELRFFPAESAAFSAQPWSPDGNALSYSQVILSARGAEQGVAVREINLGTELLLGEPGGMQGEPAWSPDGSRIAYTLTPLANPGGAGLWLQSVDGQERRQLVGEPDAIYGQPVWSPGGEWLLFVRFLPTAEGGAQSLWAIRADGSDLHRISDVGYQPVWVP